MSCKKWKVVVDTSVIKWIIKKRKHRLKRFKALQSELASNPYVGKRLRDCRNLWSVKLDRNTRIIYYIDRRECKVRVLGVGGRGSVYDEYC